jgi:predicted small lipoprotein YifL
LLASGVLACALLAACGQKGNLYLPSQKKKVPAPQTTPDTQAQPNSAPAGGSFSSGASSSGAQ